MARSTKGLYKRGNTWWMTYRDALGNQRFESCKTRNKDVAEKCLIQRRQEAMEGIAPAPQIKPVALEALCERYLAHVSTQLGVRTKRLHVEHFKRVLGNPPIHTLTVDVLDRYRETRRAEGVGPATLNRELSTFKHAMSKAVAWRLVRKSVREELAGIRKYQESSGRLRYLEGPEEAERLIQGCRDMLRPLIIMALHTGMRRGELLGLTWDAIDLKQGFIYLTRTKSGESRSIPINQTVRQALTGLRTRLDVPWVFHDLDGNRFHDVRHKFEWACKRAGIRAFRFHDLRHTFASWLVMAGVPLATVSELLGHKSLSMTMRYAHLSPKHMSRAVQVLDGAPVSSLDKNLTIQGSRPLHSPEPRAVSGTQGVA